jgi:predicted methyltransferase
MMKHRSLVLLLVSATGAFACAHKSDAPSPSASTTATAGAPAASADTEAKLRSVLAMPHRSDAERARDQYRHPVETLSFFGLRDDMNVVELWPGGGWYTEVLAPFLKDKGHLAVTNTAKGKKYSDMLAAKPDVYGKVEQRIIDAPKSMNFGPDGSADLVVTFRNIHGWNSDDKPYDDQVYAAVYKVLKSGGVFGVEEHRAKPGADPKELKGTGYISEDWVIKRVQEAGFRFVGKSEVNANPMDTKDYPKGVWTLPPTLREGDKDKDKYLAIGESDRMTLKFVKP